MRLAVSGQGILDYDTFMRRMEALGPERFPIVEHASEAEMPLAKTFLDARAQELGIRIW